MRPTFTLDEQLALMARDDGASKVDGWMTRIAEFIATVDTIQQVPEAASYIDPSHLQGIKASQALVDFVNAD